jgi:flagellar biosynthesis protein FlhF
LIECVDEELREVYLVLSATTKYKDLKQIVETYKDMSEYRLLFTKLDETGCYGNILNIRLDTGAPISYTTSGQDVPKDIETLNAQEIAKQLIGGGE